MKTYLKAFSSAFLAYIYIASVAILGAIILKPVWMACRLLWNLY